MKFTNNSSVNLLFCSLVHNGSRLLLSYVGPRNLLFGLSKPFLIFAFWKLSLFTGQDLDRRRLHENARICSTMNQSCIVDCVKEGPIRQSRFVPSAGCCLVASRPWPCTNCRAATGRRLCKALTLLRSACANTRSSFRRIDLFCIDGGKDS